MWARVSSAKVAPDKMEAVISFFRDAMPEPLEGMTEAHLLVDREKGRVTTITYWETQTAMRETAQAANEIRGQAAKAAADEIPWQVEEYEVAA